MLTLAPHTEWSNLAEMYVIVVCLAVSTLALLIVYRGMFGAADVLLFVPVAFMMFTLRQYGTLLWGYQITFALTQMTVILCLLNLYLSTRYSPATHGLRRRVAFSLAAICAVIASGSSIQGLLVWIAGLVLLIVSTIRPGSPFPGRIRRDTDTASFGGASAAQLLLWPLLGAMTWTVYFTDYRVNAPTSSVLDQVRDPAGTATFALTVLGGTFASPPRVSAFFFGCLFILLTAIVCYHLFRRTDVSRYSFWISLLVFSLLVAVSISLGRGAIGDTSAMASRYVIFSVPAWVSIYVLCVGWWRESGTRNLSFFAASAAIFAVSMQMLFVESAIRDGQRIQSSRNESRASVIDYRDALDEDLHRRVMFSPDGVRNRARILERFEYNVFSENRQTTGDPDA